MSPEVRRELQRLLSALCEREFTEAQHARLEELLAADAECRRLYLEYVDMHARLLVHPFGNEEGGRRETEEVEQTTGVSFRLQPSASKRQVAQVFRYALVAAGTLAASLLVQVFGWLPRAPEGSRAAPPAATTGKPLLPEYVATLAQTADCVWENPSQPWRVGSRLLPEEMQLRQGLARIRFDSGPELVVEGPAALRLDSSAAATILRGKVVFHADETAPPFDLHTPSSTLVDLGTEYAVLVGPESEEVHVFDGTVQRLPKPMAGQAEREQLTAGEARRYGRSPASGGQPTALDPARFVRQVTHPGQPPVDPVAGLLAYEGFAYPNPQLLRAGKANGGAGWTSPWRPGFARPIDPGARNRLALNVKESLVRAGAVVPAVGGSFDYTGFAKYWRRLGTPVRLDVEGVYYLSFLFRRHGPPADPLNALAVLFRTTDELPPQPEVPRNRLNIGVGSSNQLFTHLHGVGSRTPLPLSYGEIYLLVAKIAASSSNPDQVFMRVYGPDEPIEPEEPGSWSVVGPPFHSDLVFDWLEVHINSKTRQTIDEIRLGGTWASVTAAWISVPGAEKEGKP